MSSRARPTELRDFSSELRRGWRPAADLLVLPAVDSTNALARRSLEAAPGEPLTAPRVFVAWTQSEGRGRRGRGWSSPPGGGLYASVLLPVRARAALEVLPLLLPVVLCRALRAAGASGCGIKWPNDLTVGGRKLGGLLIEAVSVGGAPRAAVLGLGVNYRTPVEPGLATTAIGLAELVRPTPTLAAIAGRLLEAVLDRTADLEAERPSGWIEPYRALSVHRPGERIACRTAGGTLEGDFAGFDERGLLRLAVGAGERRIAAGDV